MKGIGTRIQIHKLMALALGLLLTLSGATVWAGAVLHIGDPPNAGTYLFNGHVLPIENLGVLNNDGPEPLVDPAVLLILGVPNNAGFSLPSITASIGGQAISADIGGTATYFDGSWHTGTGFVGSFGPAFSGDVYSFVGLVPGGNNSNLFGNWHDADLAVNGIDADFFGIYVYVLTGYGNDFVGKAQIDVTFASDLPTGVFVVAYGQDDKGNAYSTPFTESGLTVPEPGTVLLLGTGLLGLVAYRRRFRK